MSRLVLLLLKEQPEPICFWWCAALVAGKALRLLTRLCVCRVWILLFSSEPVVHAARHPLADPCSVRLAPPVLLLAESAGTESRPEA